MESMPWLQGHDGAHQRVQPHDLSVWRRIVLQLRLTLVRFPSRGLFLFLVTSSS